MSEPKLCCNCLHCARWRKKNGIECHCDLDDKYLGYLQVMDEENDCKQWEKETEWDLQREHDKQVRAYAIDEFVNTFIEEGKKIKYLRHIWIENTCKKIAEQLKGGADNAEITGEG